jgi:uncharacterized protein DUF5681
MSGVGPGRPPETGRFRKGTSGNPKGRPKSRGASSISAYAIIMDRTLTLTKDGKPHEVTLEEALQHRTYQEAINGNRAAQREVLKMIAKREKWFAAKRPVSPVKFLMEPKDPDNANEALVLLGIAKPEPAWFNRLRLQPWAVQAALSRPGRRRLSAEDVSNIKRCTHDAETLRWPAGARDEQGD